MAGCNVNIGRKTLDNDAFRDVLYTASRSRLVVMTLQVGEAIGVGTHAEHGQVTRVEPGMGEAILDGERHARGDGLAVVLPAGVERNVVNTFAGEPLRLYTISSPAEHPGGAIDRTKADADVYERGHHG